MGTGGFAGFVVDGSEKIFFSHKDSYPSGLGVEVLDWLTHHRDALLHPTPGGVADRVRALRLITDGTEPAAPDIERIRGLLRDRADPAHRAWLADVSEEEVMEMATYDLDTLLDAGIVVDGAASPMDSLFADWGYVVDLDAATFEVYRGRQQAPHTAGRFALRPPARAGYYPVALVAGWPLADLPNQDDFLTLPGAY